MTLGHAKSGRLLTGVENRSKRAYNLVDKLNNLIDQLPANVPRPRKLDKKSLKDLALDDIFWELEMFQSQEKWAFNKEVRRGIDAWYLHSRANEEIRILVSEAECFFEWLRSRLDAVENTLVRVDLDSLIGRRILQIGLKTAEALRKLDGLSKVKLLSTKNEFDAVMDSLKCTSLPDSLTF
jgi:hypothetical protein